MKRASYRDAIDYIAHNDCDDMRDIEEIVGLVTVQLVKNIFGVPSEKVANDILRYRIKHEII